MQAYAAARTLGQNYASILLMLLRLQQACDHPLLVKGFTSDSIERFSLEMAASLPRDMLINLLKHLQTTSAICGLCKIHLKMQLSLCAGTFTAKRLGNDGQPNSLSSPARMQGTFGYFALKYAITGRGFLKSDIFKFDSSYAAALVLVLN